MSAGLSQINRALNLIPKRAESHQAEQLRDTFVDFGIATALEGRSTTKCSTAGAAPPTAS